jgi:acyl carrier protein
MSGKTKEEELMEKKIEQELAEIRKKLKELLVTSLSLEDVKPEDIKDDEILFGEGLGLDSLDAVEIVVLLQRNFGLDVKDMNEGRKIFYSVDTLARYILENRKK